MHAAVSSPDDRVRRAAFFSGRTVQMDSILRTLNEARSAADGARDAAAGSAPTTCAVDVENEFGDRLHALARTAKTISQSLMDEGTDPVAVLGGLQRLVNDTDSLIVRYRKVDFDRSEAMRKRAVDIQFGQPDGVTQIIRNACSGVYEGGNGGTCLPAVVDLIHRTCELHEELARLVFCEQTAKENM